MARRLRVEVESGLYHVIARGNDRQDIFHSHDDRLRFLSLLAKQKARSPFFIYAFCLMTNHIHILLERQAETVGSIMQRVLGGYSPYYNRKYSPVGHVFQARHKAILCQTDRYLADAGRYFKSPANLVIPENPAKSPRAVAIRARYVEGNSPVGQFSNIVTTASQPAA